MVEQFVIRTHEGGKKLNGRKLTKQIKDRVEVCYIPDCWPLKDPNDKGSIYLPKKFIVSSSSESIKKQRRVQIRHFLFQIAYEEVLPIGRLTRMRCGNNRCINPAHIKVAGWEPDYRPVRKMVNLGWLTQEQADEWFAGIKEDSETETEQPEKPPARDIKPKPAWKEIYPAAR
jgi:hypothetical protein